MILKKKKKRTLSHTAPFFLSFSVEYKFTERKELQDTRSEQMIQTLSVSNHLIKSHELPCTGAATHMEQVSELTFSDFRPQITKVGLFPPTEPQGSLGVLSYTHPATMTVSRRAFS